MVDYGHKIVCELNNIEVEQICQLKPSALIKYYAALMLHMKTSCGNLNSYIAKEHIKGILCL